MIGSVLGNFLRAAFGPEKSAKLGTSGYNLTELEVNGVWHDDCLLLYHLRQTQQIPDGDGAETFELARTVAYQPGDDSPRVLFVLNVDGEERGRDPTSTRRK